jgi:hypothetical protein
MDRREPIQRTSTLSPHLNPYPTITTTTPPNSPRKRRNDNSPLPDPKKRIVPGPPPTVTIDIEEPDWEKINKERNNYYYCFTKQQMQMETCCQNCRRATQTVKDGRLDYKVK